ncbi:glycosyltransferase [Rhodococcus rhodochrous]|jgi:UDP-N-acetylglucosamine--N-acetylmuramyl-(pentapeptide) pyrophosphoryl-undecaprenol N-acetylglucosamine transferase|uniref:glycosyltransferase n=1 Tax=Rhodococcus rhodochrous TaxID=1829 RepID=UPI00035EA5F2|nr:glycosyltransferase [Rhodococcus rhodochrous]
MEIAEGSRRLILAASTGGHLEQLVRLAPTLGATDDSLWITFDSPQSRSLLAGKNALHVPYIAPRDYMGTFNAFRTLASYLRSTSVKYDEAISTGAALALAALPAARLAGVPTRYIESVSRTDGPSLSGRILHALRFTKLEAQHKEWATGRWSHRDSVMSAFSSVSSDTPVDKPRLFVTLGTIKPFRFDSAIDAVLRTGLADENTVWQVGCTTRTDLPGQVFETVENDQFESFVKASDVVITHSGVGSILNILGMGKYPVVLPRRKKRNEHVDDHQLQIARLVADNEIAVAVDPLDLKSEHLLEASTRRILLPEAAR